LIDPEAKSKRLHSASPDVEGPPLRSGLPQGLAVESLGTADNPTVRKIGRSAGTRDGLG
jgi:hypothetical protein